MAAARHSDAALRDAAFTRLVDAEGGKLLAFGRRFCGDGSDAEDLVQETFAHAYRAFDQLADAANARAWLYSIARRACQRMHRKRAGEPARFESLAELEPRPGESLPELPGDLGDPHDARLRAEARERVERAVAALPALFRQTLVLADIAELSLAEIAAVLGIREATVKTRLHRARLKLRQVLAEELPQRPAPDPGHARRVCLDLLHAKLEAMDRRVPFPYSSASLCERCSNLLGTLDLAASSCRALGADALSDDLRRTILDAAPKG
jgi:RNA polymerase sigma-70 factor (ECF subfamily)